MEMAEAVYLVSSKLVSTNLTGNNLQALLTNSG